MNVELIGSILGGTGVIMGSIYTIFTMKVKKEGISIDNLKKVIDEIQKNHKEYTQETDTKIEKLEKQMLRMELKNELQTRAINKGYRCPYPQDGEECPVTKMVDATCKIIDKTTQKK